MSSSGTKEMQWDIHNAKIQEVCNIHFIKSGKKQLGEAATWSIRSELLNFAA
jgi:hypothetical protein